MELASLVRDILRQRHVERLAQHREQDNEAEAEWGDRPLAASQRGGDPAPL
ncbi:hypothetical protein HUZ58_14500 [Klebsiella pneumoniae]|nr:hypothetical protein HUZ58_14500 [Klebsiella pneumoniae]